MNPILALITAGLLSIHQYIPKEKNNYIQYFDEIKEAEASNIFPAANQSCLYLQSVFVTAGLEKGIGDLAYSGFGDVLREAFQPEIIEAVIDFLSFEENADKVRDYGLKPEEVIDFLKKICKKDFSPLDFSYLEGQQVLALIQNEIHVLSKKDLNTLGSFQYFGTGAIKDRQGRILTSLNPENRTWLSYSEIPKSLILAVLAAEDRRFFIHEGSDEIAISRIAKQFLANQRITGGSTLTMQLLKNMYFESKSSNIIFFQQGKGALLLRKVREWYWAKIFENHFKKTDLFHKKQILELYFNLVYLGRNIQGVEQASQVYFSKSARELSLAESAYIVTLLKAPNTYSNPKNYYVDDEESEKSQTTKFRRDDYVLNRVGTLCTEIAQGQFLSSKKKVQSLMKELCKINEKKITLDFIEEQKKETLPHWEAPQIIKTEDYIIPIQKQVEAKINTIDFSSRNDSKELSIQTTIDKNLQKVLFDVMRSYLDQYDSRVDELSQVEPIRSSSNKKETIIFNDIPYSLNYRIQGLLSFLEEEELKWFYAIRLNPHSFYLDFKNGENFLKSLNKSEAQIKQLRKSVEGALRGRSGSVGTLIFISLDKTGIFSFYSLEEVLNKTQFSEERIARIQSYLSPHLARDFIYKRALNRIYQGRQRDELEPLLYLGGQGVRDKSLQEVTLIESHRFHLNAYQVGDFFWAKKEQNNSYRLQGEKVQAAAFVINSKSGQVLARFDGYNVRNNYFHRATQAKRQTGSIIKPFTYLYTLDQKNFYPQSLLNNDYVAIPINNQKTYIPKNPSNRYSGELSLSQALIHSQNIATVSLITDPRWGRTQWRGKLAELMSFYKSFGLYKGHNEGLYPSMLLGSEEESISGIVSAYSSFANGTYTIKPYFIQNVKNYQGRDFHRTALDNPFPDVTRYSSFFQIRALLLQIANIGTARRLSNFPYNLEGGKYRSLCYNNFLKPNLQSCFGGKTGTSNEKKDLWFVGFSENFVIGIWMGYDSNRPLVWRSSKLVDIFKSIVEQGVDYLPPIKPLLKPEDIPLDLEKRTVYGNQACSQPIEESVSYTIFTDPNSEENCYRNNEDYLLQGTQSSQNDEDLLQGTQSSQNQALCFCLEAEERETNSAGELINVISGYTLDIHHKGQIFEKLEFFLTLSECHNKKKKYVDTQTQEKLCY